MKKKILTTLSVVLVLGLAALGILAYLTDTDNDVNVMTLGEVKIAQHEYERVQNDDGTYEMVTSEKYGEGYKLQEFTQDKPLYPATGTITGWGTKVPFDQIEGASGVQAVFAGLSNVQDKFVLVENTGKSDAYVRTLIALEYGSNTKDIIGISTGDFWTWNPIGIIEAEGNNYYLFEAIYKGSSTRHIDGVLPSGEYTYNSLGQVYMKNEAANEDVENLDGNKNGTYDILVFSQAVQTAGFENAEAALDAAFGDITVSNHPWVDASIEWPGQENSVTEIKVTTPEELTAALANVEGETIIDGTGVIVEINANEYCVALPGNIYSYNIPAGVTIKGVTFGGKYRGGNFLVFTEGEGTIVFEECTFGDTDRSFGLAGTENGPKTVIFNNCNFKGQILSNNVDNLDATSEFNACTFAKSNNGRYHFVEAMGGTHNFNNCTFDYTGVSQTNMGVITSGHINVYSEPEYSTNVVLNSCTRTNCGTRTYGPNSSLVTK